MRLDHTYRCGEFEHNYVQTRHTTSYAENLTEMHQIMIIGDRNVPEAEEHVIALIVHLFPNWSFEKLAWRPLLLKLTFENHFCLM